MIVQDAGTDGAELVEFVEEKGKDDAVYFFRCVYFVCVVCVCVCGLYVCVCV